MRVIESITFSDYSLVNVDTPKEGDVVCKYGCSTCYTVGIISGVGMNIEVEPLSVGPFAVPGDSGAVVVNVKTKVVVGIISMVKWDSNDQLIATWKCIVVPASSFVPTIMMLLNE